jgi:hypothetical protein
MTAAILNATGILGPAWSMGGLDGTYLVRNSSTGVTVEITVAPRADDQADYSMQLDLSLNGSYGQDPVQLSFPATATAQDITAPLYRELCGLRDTAGEWGRVAKDGR